MPNTHQDCTPCRVALIRFNNNKTLLSRTINVYSKKMSSLKRWFVSHPAIHDQKFYRHRKHVFVYKVNNTLMINVHRLWPRAIVFVVLCITVGLLSGCDLVVVVVVVIAITSQMFILSVFFINQIMQLTKPLYLLVCLGGILQTMKQM